MAMIKENSKCEITKTNFRLWFGAEKLIFKMFYCILI